jgi:hypothetical protein
VITENRPRCQAVFLMGVTQAFSPACLKIHHNDSDVVSTAVFQGRSH